MVLQRIANVGEPRFSLIRDFVRGLMRFCANKIAHTTSSLKEKRKQTSAPFGVRRFDSCRGRFYKMSEIYEPEEDSYLMSEAIKAEIPKLLKKNLELKFLEVGCGSGINLLSVKKIGVKVENILGSDINPEAVKHCKKLGFRVINSNLFNNIKGKFDIIVFNPPYLPLDKREPKSSRRETTGGKKGNEIIIKFLKQAKKHLAEGGRIFIITSSLSENINFRPLGYRAKEISNKKLFFEKIFVWELNFKRDI